MKTCPHSVHSFSAVSSLLMVGVSRSVRAVAERERGWEGREGRKSGKEVGREGRGEGGRMGWRSSWSERNQYNA